MARRAILFEINISQTVSRQMSDQDRKIDQNSSVLNLRTHAKYLNQLQSNKVDHNAIPNDNR
jgi:hypothetical protein